MQVIAKKAGISISRIHKQAKEMLPEIPRKMILHIHSAFSPEDIFMKLLVQVKTQKSILLFAKPQKEIKQWQLPF